MDMIEDVDFELDTFDDIVAKDSRYDRRAYALLMTVVAALMKDDHHVTGADILDEFKESALDQYGPLTYLVLTEWGVTCCEDVGEMMFNLAEGHRVRREDDDTAEDFRGGYDFKETFLGPYQS